MSRRAARPPVRRHGRPATGAALGVLGALTVAAALRPRGWWRWAPGALSAAVLAVAYWRLTRAPSGTFADPLLRRALRPAWGFVPMGLAVLLGIAGAAGVRPRPARPLPPTG